jgi:hypothetical protein
MSEAKISKSRRQVERTGRRRLYFSSLFQPISSLHPEMNVVAHLLGPIQKYTLPSPEQGKFTPSSVPRRLIWCNRVVCITFGFVFRESITKWELIIIVQIMNCEQ